MGNKLKLITSGLLTDRFNYIDILFTVITVYNINAVIAYFKL